MSKDMKTELEKIRAMIQVCDDPVCPMCKSMNTLLSHISDLEERIAFLEKALRQAVSLGKLKMSTEMAYAGWIETENDFINCIEHSTWNEFAVYLRTQGGKS